jgi:glutamyl-tRNA synthetase
MAQILTVPTKQSPFPYAATGIAAYTDKAEIVFDDSAPALALAVDGSTINDEDVIVQSLAKQSGLAEDSAKVCRQVPPC